MTERRIDYIDVGGDLEATLAAIEEIKREFAERQWLDALLANKGTIDPAIDLE